VPSVRRHVDRLARAYDPWTPPADACAHHAARQLEVLGDHVTMRQPARRSQWPKIEVELDELTVRLNARPPKRHRFAAEPVGGSLA
jgi:hypothetical protein